MQILCAVSAAQVYMCKLRVVAGSLGIARPVTWPVGYFAHFIFGVFIMSKISVSLLVFSLFFLSAAPAISAIDESERTLRPGLGVIDRVICVDGLKLFQTTGMGGGTSTVQVISTIQLYETKNGKVVPATCNAKAK